MSVKGRVKDLWTRLALPSSPASLSSPPWVFFTLHLYTEEFPGSVLSSVYACPLMRNLISQDLSDRKGPSHPRLDGPKAQAGRWPTRTCQRPGGQYLLHGVRGAEDPTAAAAGAGRGVRGAPRWGPAAWSLHCEDLFVRKAQLVEELLVFIHRQLQKAVS